MISDSSVFCIDWGNSYTKIAVRPSVYEDADLFDARALNRKDITIPSLLVFEKDEKNRPAHWFSGFEAADMHCSSRVAIVENWKRDIMTNQFARYDTQEMMCVFFKMLHEEVCRRWNLSEESILPTRIAVPTFVLNQEAVKKQIRNALLSSGWAPLGLTFATEPESNLIGIVTKGKNSQALRTMMEGSVLISAYRNSTGWHNVLRRFRGNLGNGAGMLVIDIGSFTTDMGYVFWTQDALSGTQKPSGLIQRSYDLGIRRLTERIENDLSQSSLDALKGESFNVREACTQRLLAGQSYTLISRVLENKTLEIGNDDEQRMIEEKAECYANELVENGLERFMADEMTEFRNLMKEDLHDSGEVQMVALTGGGAQIVKITRRLSAAIQRIFGLKCIISSEKKIQRGSSAIGGASRYFCDFYKPQYELVAAGSVIPNDQKTYVSPNSSDNEPDALEQIESSFSRRVEENVIFTIGYDGRRIDDFINLLCTHKIRYIVDIRDKSAILNFEDRSYQAKWLKPRLRKRGISYTDFSENLSARSLGIDGFLMGHSDPNGILNLEIYQVGLRRLMNGINGGFTLCILASEKRPDKCHRNWLLGDHLASKGIQVRHLVDQDVVSQNQLSEIILEKHLPF